MLAPVQDPAEAGVSWSATRSRQAATPLAILAIAVGAALYVLCATISSAASSNSAVGGMAPVTLFHGDVASRSGREFSYSEWLSLRSVSEPVADLSAVSYVPVHFTAFGQKQSAVAAFVSSRDLATLNLPAPSVSLASITTSQGAKGAHFSCAGDEDGPPCEQAILEARYVRDALSDRLPDAIEINGHRLHVEGTIALDSTASRPAVSPAVFIPLSDEPALTGDDWRGRSFERFLTLAGRLPTSVLPADASRAISGILARSGGGVTVLPASLASLTQMLRLTPRGASLVVYDSPWLALFALVFATVLSCGPAWKASAKYRKGPGATSIVNLAGFATVSALAGVASGFVIAALLLRLVNSVSRGARLSFVAPNPSLHTGEIALVAAVLAAIAGAVTTESFEPARLARSIKVRSLYVPLCIVIVLLMAVAATNGIFVGDFWDHSASIRALAAHPLHPSHPIFRLDMAHQFFSPYSLALALVSRMSGLSPVDSLRVAGVINIIALLACFYLFTSRVFGRGDMPVYGLICLLFLWGPGAWVHSGFLHFNSLVQTGAYPSTFVSALTFLVWYLAVALRERAGALFAALAVLIPLSLISHPLTSIALLVGVSVLGIQPGYPNRSRVAIAVAVVSAFGTVALWPLFSFYGLLTQSSRWAVDAQWLYSNYPAILVRILPALVGLPLVIYRIRKRPTDFIGLSSTLLLGIYIYGGVTGKYVYGRVLPFLAVMLQLALADWLANTRFSREPRLVMLRRGGMLAIVFGALTMLPGLATCLPIWQNSYGEFRFLSAYVRPDDVVLADEQTSLKEPSFGGRVVAFTGGHTVGFVPDLAERNADRDAFFLATTSDQERMRIVARYQVGYVLINLREVAEWPAVLRSVERFGRVRYWDGDMILVSISG